ncbi:unnamed protein product, partial [Ranitomeya imitator]
MDLMTQQVQLHRLLARGAWPPIALTQRIPQ